MLALLCPGQGAQAPGMLTPWLELPGVAERAAWMSAVTGLDLVGHGTTSTAEVLRDTAVAQPMIVATGLLAARVLLPGPGGAPGPRDAPAPGGAPAAVAGHSVGEVTAAALAGVLTEEAALVLVRERGRAMAAAAAVTATGMSAVVGGGAEDVEAAITRSGASAANRNGAGQVVAAGTTERLAALAADPPARARVVPLQVAGAFHTQHMAPAVQVLAALAPAVPTADPRTALVSNADGTVLADGSSVVRRLVAQVASPVRWDLCQQTLAGLGVTAVLELPPAGALAGLAKRSLPGVEVLALRSPEDLDAARDLLARHGGPA